MSEATGMRVVELKVANVKRLRAVAIKPDGSIVQITGRNGQGKSSVLDSILYALGGKGAQPSAPIRRGAEKASVALDLGDLVVKRTWTASGGTYLSVESKNGATFKSPQAILDKLAGSLTFDPLAFTRMKPAEQVETLRRITGLDFADLDRHRAKAFEERTGINRELAADKATLGNTPEVEAPDHEVSLTQLTGEHTEAAGILRRNDQQRTQAATLRHHVEAQTRHVEDLERQLAEARAKLDSVKSQSEAADLAVAKLVDPDLTAITQKMRDAEATNQRVRAKQFRKKLVARVAELAQKSNALTVALDNIDATKQQMLAAAKMPIDNLSFSADGVTYNGIPLEQASSAEQLRISVAVGLALNPTLRVMLIRDGSLLDKASMQLLAEMADANDAQVWIERVTDGEKVGVVIEDGAIQEAPSETPAPAPEPGEEDIPV